MGKTNLQKTLNSIYENYTCIKDVHDTAYTHNKEYKIFWDNHPETTKSKLLKAQKAMSISNGADKTKEALFHLATFGVSYGAKKLFQKGKPSREEKIKEVVTSNDFTEVIKLLNESLWGNK